MPISGQPDQFADFKVVPEKNNQSGHCRIVTDERSDEFVRLPLRSARLPFSTSPFRLFPTFMPRVPQLSQQQQRTDATAR